MMTDSHEDGLVVSHWRAGNLRGRLFAIAWAAAVVTASAGWFYLIFGAVWYLIGPLIQ
jgi:hypothetical protein